MKKFLTGALLAVAGSYFVMKRKEELECLDKKKVQKERPILRKTIDEKGRITFKVMNPNLNEKGVDESPISYYGADLCIDPEEVEGDFYSVTFPEMRVDGSEVYVNILAEYRNNGLSAIDQVTSIKLSDPMSERVFTKYHLDQFIEKKGDGINPVSLSMRFHAKHNGNYEMTDKKTVSRYPLEIKFVGNTNTRLIMSMWSRVDVAEVSDVFETVYHVNKQ